MCREMSPDGERMDRGALVRAVASVDPGRGGGAPYNFARRRSGGRAGRRSPPAERHPGTRPPRLVIDRRPRSLGPSTAAPGHRCRRGPSRTTGGCSMRPRPSDARPWARAAHQRTPTRRPGPDGAACWWRGDSRRRRCRLIARGDTADYRHRKRQSSPHEFGPLALLCWSERSRPRRRAGFDHREFVANAARDQRI